MDLWLSQPVKYDDTYLIKDVLDLMCQRIYGYILQNPDMNLPMDYATFFALYADVALQGFSIKRSSASSQASKAASSQASNESAKDHFDLAYEQDILELFQETHEISEHYDLKLASTSCDLHEFLRETLDLAYDTEDLE
jgi:hypothetical protein